MQSGPFPHIMGGWMLQPEPLPRPAEPSAEDAIPTRRSRPPSSVPPRPDGTPTATACTCSSSPPEREAGSSGSSSAAGAANSDSAPPGSSPWLRPASGRSPTASSPAPAATPSPKSAAPKVSRPSPRPPRASSNRSAAAGAAGGTHRTGGGAWSATSSPESAGGPSPRSTRPTCWRSLRRSGTSRRRRPGRSASVSGRCWNGRSPSTCGTTTRATGWYRCSGRRTTS